MGGGGFGASKFEPRIYRHFLQLIAMQQTYLTVFNILGIPFTPVLGSGDRNRQLR